MRWELTMVNKTICSIHGEKDGKYCTDCVMAKFQELAEKEGRPKGFEKVAEVMSKHIRDTIQANREKPLTLRIYEAMVRDGYGGLLKPVCQCGHYQPCEIDDCGCCKCEG